MTANCKEELAVWPQTSNIYSSIKRPTQSDWNSSAHIQRQFGMLGDQILWRKSDVFQLVITKPQDEWGAVRRGTDWYMICFHCSHHCCVEWIKQCFSISASVDERKGFFILSQRRSSLPLLIQMPIDGEWHFCLCFWVGELYPFVVKALLMAELLSCPL